MATVYQQAWGLCVAYLSLGLIAELLRRGGVNLGLKAQAFLDGLPLFAMHYSGFIEPYLRAVVDGQLTPFLNRLLLASITMGIIVAQATLTGLLILLFGRGLRPRPR